MSWSISSEVTNGLDANYHRFMQLRLFRQHEKLQQELIARYQQAEPQSRPVVSEAISAEALAPGAQPKPTNETSQSEHSERDIETNTILTPEPKPSDASQPLAKTRPNLAIADRSRGRKQSSERSPDLEHTANSTVSANSTLAAKVSAASVCAERRVAAEPETSGRTCE